MRPPESTTWVDVPGMTRGCLHQMAGEDPAFQAEFLPVMRAPEAKQQPIHGVQGETIFWAQATFGRLVLDPLKARLRRLL